jgi:hypothetical protein
MDDPYADYNPRQTLTTIWRTSRCRGGPGERCEYSNLGVGLLGHALAFEPARVTSNSSSTASARRWA